MISSYDFNLNLGNSCVIKCSELAVATSNVLHKLIPKYLDEVCTLCYIIFCLTKMSFVLYIWGEPKQALH